MNASENSEVKLGDVAKSLAIGRTTFFKQLRSKRILDAKNLPRERYVRRGLFKVRQRQWVDTKRNQYRDYWLVLVTPEGERFIQKQLQNDDAGAVLDERQPIK